jgi:uncharacterized membrane protein
MHRLRVSVAYSMDVQTDQCLCCTIFFFLQNGLNVVPVIGMISDKALFKPVLNKDEVEDIFDAPLEMFLKVLLSLSFIVLELRHKYHSVHPCGH